MRGKDRYRHVKSSQTSRKEDRPLVFSGVLGVTTGGENQVEVNGRPGFVWVRLRNQLNELIQAFNETVAPVFDLPVLVEYDKANPIRYKVISRDVGRYTVWVTTNAAGDTVPSTSAYLPAHGASHSFNKLTGVGGGDVVWVYSDQFIPWLVTPSGSSGANSVSVQPSAYYYDDQFRWAGGTGIAGFDTLLPTGSSNARMLLVYLDPDTGTPFLATGSLTEFDNSITGTAEIMPYMPSLIEPTDIPLAGVRLITGSSVLLWQNLYDLRDYFAHSSTSGSSGGGGAPTDAEYVVMSADGTLTDERVLTAGTDIDIADGGAGGNATVSIPTGTFERPGHAHAHINELPIYEDSVFQATGTIIDFGENVNVAVTGSVVFVSTIDTTGGGGGADLLIYDDSVFQVTGTAISFDDNLDVSVTGSTAFVAGQSGVDTTLMTLFTIEGDLVVESNPLRIYNNFSESKTISEVFLSVSTPPTDAPIIVDVHKDGTTIFTDQNNRPSISTGTYTGNTTTIDVPAWADGEYLTMDVDQIGSGTAGSDLTVHISYTYSRIMMSVFTDEGTLSVENKPLRIYNNFNETKTISEVFLSVNTAPTDASIIVDVNKDGTTIFTAQGNRPLIATGANTGNTTSIDIPSWAVGEYLTVDIDQIGSGTAGSDLSIHIIHS